MTIMSMSDVAAVAYDAGFRGSDLVVAVAVARAESGLDSRAHNTNVNTGDNSYGLWQINMLGKLQAPRLVQFGIRSNDELFTPATNAHAAFVLYKARGRRFGDWSTYNHGSHKRWLDDADAAVRTMLDTRTPVAPKPAGAAFTLSRFLYVASPRMHGGDVQAAQRRLIALGFHLPKWGADGVYGDETHSAVLAAQHRYRLDEDGVIGPDTAHALGGVFR